MSAEIVPFPVARRVDLVVSTARRMLELSPDRSERHLELACDRQAMVLRRRGIDATVVGCEISAFAAAVRSAIWHAVMAPVEGGR
jgi:Asp/Glu/hydantoin racemase